MAEVFVTRKIQLIIDTDNKEEYYNFLVKLYKYQDICMRAANLIYTHQYLMMNIRDMIYLHDETKVKLANIDMTPEGILNTSKLNTTYRILSKNFKGEIPTTILTALNSRLVSTFNKESKEYFTGARSLRNYKKDIPIPFPANALMYLKKLSGKRDFSFTLFNIPFKTYLGKDFYDKTLILDRIVNDELKLAESSVQIKNKKIFLLLVHKFQRQEIALDAEKVADVLLSSEVPLIAIIDGQQYKIGNREEYIYRRTAMQSALHRTQKSSVSAKGGKGRQRKLKSMLSFKELESNYITTQMHLYSAQLISLCVKLGIGKIRIRDYPEKDIPDTPEKQFVIRNFSFGNLGEKIQYKSKKMGIECEVEKEVKEVKVAQSASDK